MMANLIARSAHEDELIAVYFNSNAILAAECAELFAKGQERASVSFQAKPLVAVVGVHRFSRLYAMRGDRSCVTWHSCSTRRTRRGTRC